MANFVILLPPSEGKQPGGNPFAPDMFDYRSSNTFNFFSELNSDRRRLIEALHQAIETETDLEALFGLQGATLEEAIRANRSVLDSPLMAALDRYSPGVMYQAMDFPGLPTGAQRRLLERCVIFSGLFGLLRPDDLIPDYRLAMDARLPGVGRVSSFWRPRLSPVLNRTLEDCFVWNLLPGIHREAWEDEHRYAGMADVKFVRLRGGVERPLSHSVKPLRGALVNFLVRESADAADALEAWAAPAGFRFDPTRSAWDEPARSGTLVMVNEE